MNDEIDLKKFIRFLFSKWIWFLASGLVVCTATGLYLGLSPQNFEATAMVIITRPRNIPNFDSRFETLTNFAPAYKAYLDLATGDELWLPLFNEWEAVHTEDKWILQSFKKMGKASAGSDQSVIMLTIKWKDPEEAARLANEWAESFVRLANEIYGGKSQEQLLFFQQQLNDSRADLEKKSAALEDFMALHSVEATENELDALLSEQQDYLNRKRSYSSRLMDARSIIEQLETRPADVTSVADQVTFLMMQTRLYTTSGSSTPFLLQIDPATINSGSPEQQIIMLETWIKSMENQSTAVEEHLKELEPQILEKQQKFQKLNDEKARLTREQEVAKETFTTMARKVDESRILTMDETGDVKLASNAIAPQQPVSRYVLQYTVVAGAATILLIGIIFSILYWWRSIKSSNGSEQGQTETSKADQGSH
ncbi:MAG TPA: Wzz/FepE/Etk N-terminal domain-containing protein [Anaerolineaceae bacterium]|nr:Wzz/FepE/Etk N-terminal domain-containing protein [Anaerolineaceae bacterium]HPN51785.1 Wzz/FepE/Etk N-terminal domain-containing protein [Anaerolineaceae bacterium]